MNTRNILVILTCIICTQGFDFKLKYCRFRCDNSCEAPEDKSNPIGSASPPGAYYWRDFHGVIPTDAYQLGPSTQFPQTYIGLAYDPSKNGIFATTIYDGLDYVYTVLNNETTKVDKTIQILCTKSPGQLSWVKLTTDNINDVAASHKFVLGGIRHKSKGVNPDTHYVVKTDKCHVTYAGILPKLDTDLEYALIDGSSDITKEYMWLVYKEKGPENNPETSGPSTSKSFFSHHYEYTIRPDSIIPKFYKQITIGSCSVTCSNEESGSIRKAKNDEALSASMAYYWKPKPVVDKEDAFLAGKDSRGRPLYIGQGYITTNAWDDGPSDLKSVTIITPNHGVVEYFYYQVLSSNFPEKLKWVTTTVEDFPNQDKNRLIPGGAYANGTESYVCREVNTKYNDTYLGSARVWTIGTFCNDLWGAVKDYEILMYDSK